MIRHTGYLFETKEECCNAYYPWNVDGCMNPALLDDPCAVDNVFSKLQNPGYNEEYLVLSEYGYYPKCKYYPVIALFAHLHIY